MNTLNTYIKKVSTAIVLTQALLLFTYNLSAQTCTQSSLYGWATENGGTTGGEGGTEIVVTNMADLNAAAAGSDTVIIYVDGTLTGEAIIDSNKTVFGLPGAKIQGNIRISNTHNVIVRNLIVRGDPCLTYDDCKNGVDAINTSNSTNVWIDHLDIADGQDGNCDVTSASDFVTISWCKFSYTWNKEHRFSNLIGSDDSIATDVGHLNVTYHHNWWADRIEQRQPRVRYGKIHVANNLYTAALATGTYLVGPGYLSDVLVESNVTTTNVTPIKPYPGYIAVLGRNNIGPKGPTANGINLGTVFTPPYVMPIDATTNLETTLRNCAGATLSDPRITGIENETWVKDIQVYPQPFQNELKVEVPSGCTYKIYDLQGKLIFENGEGNSTIETSSLSPGLYFLSLSKDGKMKHFKIQKM